MSLRSRANYVAKVTQHPVHLVEHLINDLGKDSAELAHSHGITLKEADLQLIQERYRVICATCHSDYGLGYSAVQGNDCASTVHEHQGTFGIHCSYGSDFDSDYWEFVGEPPSEFTAKDEKGRLPDPVCDACLMKLIESGAVKKYSDESYPWGPPWTA